MAMKLQKIYDIEQTLHFTEYDFLQLFSKSFPFTKLGRIYELLPLKEVAAEWSSHLQKRNIRKEIHRCSILKARMSR